MSQLTKNSIFECFFDDMLRVNSIIMLLIYDFMICEDVDNKYEWLERCF